MKKTTILPLLTILIPIILFGEGLEYARVSIVPEYEGNNMVIFISGKTDSTGMNGSLEFAIPQETDSLMQIKFIGENDVDVQPFPFSERSNGNWVNAGAVSGEFAFMIISHHFHNPGKRDFTFNMEFNQVIQGLSLEIQEPPMATQFHSSEADAEIEDDPHGQKIHRVHLHDFKPGTQKSIHISYINERGITTKGMLQEMMGNQSDMPPARMQRENEPVVRHKLYLWQPTLIAIILAVFIGGIYKMQPGAIEENACQECKAPLVKNAKFCSSCGSKLA
ncbi:MAG: zinc ribbon domain-containing protein [Candidatus Marinimicrobia bacterium]|nr:zinc ribbon domain-containing protein [Candidatus Neomarinimicrobiota bacterium]